MRSPSHQTMYSSSNILNYGHSIRYLNPGLRFIIPDVTTSHPDVDEPPLVPVEPETNIANIKRFCGLARNTTANKKWKTENSKIVAGTAVYLLVLDTKKSYGYTTKNPPKVTPSYHYVTTHDSRIAEEQILSCESMATSSERANIAVRMAIDHHLWKKKAQAKYSRKCCLYIAMRVAGEIVSSRFYYLSNHFIIPAATGLYEVRGLYYHPYGHGMPLLGRNTYKSFKSLGTNIRRLFSFCLTSFMRNRCYVSISTIILQSSAVIFSESSTVNSSQSYQQIRLSQVSLKNLRLITVTSFSR
jgi:hypothetical protein